MSNLQAGKPGKTTATTVPKTCWDSPKEAQACLREWQNTLALNDWHIHLHITTEVPEGGLGFCEPDWTMRFANIYVAGSKSGRMYGNALRVTQEFLLIHELIHCILPRFGNTGGNSLEEAWYGLTTHQITERLARALFCTKYNLKPEWFFQ